MRNVWSLAGSSPRRNVQSFLASRRWENTTDVTWLAILNHESNIIVRFYTTLANRGLWWKERTVFQLVFKTSITLVLPRLSLSQMLFIWKLIFCRPCDILEMVLFAFVENEICSMVLLVYCSQHSLWHLIPLSNQFQIDVEVEFFWRGMTGAILLLCCLLQPCHMRLTVSKAAERLCNTEMWIPGESQYLETSPVG